MQFEPVIRMPTAWTSVAGRFSVHVFEGEVTVGDMNEMEAIGDQWFERRPGKLVELTIVLPSNTRMSAEERTRMAQIIKHWERHRVASGTVILADGLMGAMQRSVLTGLLMLVPPPHPSKIFGKIPDAVTWLAPHIRALCGAGATRDAALLAVERECAAFKSR
jgi:hypothetical protein